MRRIRVLTVDDHEVVRNGVKEILAANDDMEVVGEATEASQALELASRLEPDVVLIDISMPGGSGLDLVRQLRRQLPHAVAVILTLYDKEVYVHQALQAGAYGYVLKGAPGNDITQAVRAARRKEYFLSQSIRAGVIDAYLRKQRGEETLNDYDRLSEREQQVFRLLAEGHSTVEIADLLFVSPKTVEKHRASIMRKLDLPNLVALVKYAMRIGVIEPEFGSS